MNKIMALITMGMCTVLVGTALFIAGAPFVWLCGLMGLVGGVAATGAALSGLMAVALAAMWLFPCKKHYMKEAIVSVAWWIAIVAAVIIEHDGMTLTIAGFLAFSFMAFSAGGKSDQMFRELIEEIKWFIDLDREERGL